MNNKMMNCVALFILIIITIYVTSCTSYGPPPVTAQTGWIKDETFEKKVFFGTTRVDNCPGQDVCALGTDRFNTGNERTDKIKYGEVTVKIPYIKDVGGIAGMSLNPNIRVTSWDDLKKNISSDDLLIFIHGFNTSFEESAIRCAQISFDLNFSGEAVFFSWPAGTHTEYSKDKERARENISHLSDFLTMIAYSTDKKIHIIAHSMGAYILSNALMTIDVNIKKGDTSLDSRMKKNGNKIFNQVIIAAGDEPKDKFVDMFNQYEFVKLADGYTLYSTYRDIPLYLSRAMNSRGFEKNGQPRIGDSRDSFLVIDGMDTVDAREEVSTQIMGHSYFANYSQLIYDMYLLLNYKIPPDGRLLIQVIDKENHKLWFIRPTQN